MRTLSGARNWKGIPWVATTRKEAAAGDAWPHGPLRVVKLRVKIVMEES